MTHFTVNFTVNICISQLIWLQNYIGHLAVILRPLKTVYTASPDEHLSQWLDDLPLSLWLKVMHDNASYQTAIWHAHHSWNLRLSFENPNDLTTLFPRPQPNGTSPVNIETRSLWERRASHFKNCPLEWNSRCRQTYYFAPDKIIGRKVV